MSVWWVALGRYAARVPMGARLGLAWVVSRALMLVFAAGAYAAIHGQLLGDVRRYSRWAAGPLAHGEFPPDIAWQYPPAVAGIIWLPHLAASQYQSVFLALTLLCDLAILLVVTRRSGPRRIGAWVWILGGLLLGPIMLVRFDIVAALLAVLGVALVGSTVLAGAALGLGGLVKLWPGLLVACVPGGSRRRVLRAAALTAGATLAAVTLFGPSGWTGFLHHGAPRGLQIESVPATPFVILHALGVGSDPVLRYGAVQVTTPGAGAVALVCKALLAAVTVAVVVRALGTRDTPGLSPADQAFLLVLTMLTISPLLSAQFIVWVLAMAALKAAYDDATSPAIVVLLIAAALTQIVYPLLYHQIVIGNGPASLVLVARNVLLVVSLALAWRELADRRHRSIAQAWSTPSTASVRPSPRYTAMHRVRSSTSSSLNSLRSRAKNPSSICS